MKEKHTANITQKTIDFPSNIDKARKIFLRGPNTLFLGAGVSMSAGLPSWKNLLSDLLEKADRKFNKDHYDEVFEECGYSSIVFGRLIQTAFGKKGFHKEIRDIIYKNKEHSSLITTICDIIKSNRLIVNGVITYNYDDLIEQELSKIGVKNYSIYENNEPDVVFPIYHVHGLLTQEAPIDSTIVLSEKEYHERYKRSFHWSNIEQLHALQRTNCFFIGLSMTDPNLRRLLEVSRDEKGESVPPLRHFAFINKNDVGNKLYEDERNKFIDIYEKMLEQLGVGVIWYNDYENLPYELLKLSQADKK